MDAEGDSPVPCPCRSLYPAQRGARAQQRWRSRAAFPPSPGELGRAIKQAACLSRAIASAGGETPHPEPRGQRAGREKPLAAPSRGPPGAVLGAQPRQSIPVAIWSPLGAPASRSLALHRVLRVHRRGSPRSAHSPRPSTHQQPLAALIGHPWRLERVPGCPPWGPWLSVALAAAPAPARFNPRAERAGQRNQEGRDWWGGHVPAPGLPLHPGSRGMCQAGGCPVPGRRVGGNRARGPPEGLLLAPTPPASPNPRHGHDRWLPGVSQEAVKDLPAADRRPCGQLAPSRPAGGRRGAPCVPSQSWSRSGRGGRQRRDWAQCGASSGLSCRGGHRWEPIAFCPGASHARAAQGGRPSGLCLGQVLLHQAREGDAAPPDHCSCPILGLLGPGGRLGLTFLPPGRDGGSCKTAGRVAVQAAVFADPTPAPGALAGRERTPAPSQGSPTEAQCPSCRGSGAISRGARGSERIGRERGWWR